MFCTTQGKCIIENFESNLLDLYKSYYNELMEDYNLIFPDLNRNSGGVQFFHYLFSNKHNYNKSKFDILNKFYCGVSGSVIYPERILTLKDDKYIFNQQNKANDLVIIKDLNDGFKCGFYYRCCIPCSSDIMNYEQVNVRVEEIEIELKDGKYIYNVLTIPDPCKKSFINYVISEKEDNTYEEEYLLDPDPELDQLENNPNPKWREVSAFKCENKSTVNGIKTNSGRLIFAILFDAEECNEESFKNKTYYNQSLMDFHEKRKISDKSNVGMGKIFVQLTNM